MGRNWDWSFETGKAARLKAAELAMRDSVPVPNRPPFHSHDATMQSYFNRGWFSVTRADIYLHLSPICKEEGKSLLEKIREFRSCRFPS